MTGYECRNPVFFHFVKKIMLGLLNCDIVCYDSGLVAIYVGDEKVVYASEAEGCVCYGDLDMESIAAIKQIISYSDDIEGVG